MDTQWCLNCERYLISDQDSFCSTACYHAAHALSSPSPSLQLPSLSALKTPTMSASPTSSWPAPGDDGIRAWARAVVPGPPRQHLPQSSSFDEDEDDRRTPSPKRSPRRPSRASTSTTPSSRRPKLLQLATAPLPPSVSVSFSSTETACCASSSRGASPVPSPPQPIASPTRRLNTRVLDSRPSSASCTTAPTSAESLATPVTPAHPIPIAKGARGDAHKVSLWKQVRTWVGPSPPTPRGPLVHGVDTLSVFRTKRHPLVLADEDLLPLPSPLGKADKFAALVADDDDDDDDETDSDGLAGWFVQRVDEQRKAREVKHHATSPAPGSVRKAAPAAIRPDHSAFAKRGRKLERAAATATYYAMR